LTIFWVIKNPSDFRFIVKNQVYDVFINGKFIKKVGAVEDVEVLSNGTLGVLQSPHPNLFSKYLVSQKLVKN
jgi:hypothetical protein